MIDIYIFRRFLSAAVGSSLLYTGFLQLQQAGTTLQFRRPGVSLQLLLLLQSTGSRHTGFSSCSMWVQQLRCMGLVVLKHVESSQIRDQTHGTCTGRRILNHGTTREVQRYLTFGFTKSVKPHSLPLEIKSVTLPLQRHVFTYLCVSRVISFPLSK